jgi:predicted GNAT family acetyltransferase
MNHKTFTNASDFLEAIRPAVEASEAANNLLYGLALQIQRLPGRYQPPPFFGGVYQQGRLTVAALMTPPHNLIVLSEEKSSMDEGFAVMAAALHGSGWLVPGVIGPNAPALAFARAWKTLTGRAYRLADHERVYQLRSVTWPEQPPGVMRLAAPDDLELCARWLHEFNCEALPDEPSTLWDARETAKIKISDGNFFLWEDGSPTALAGRSRITPHGACIGPVYTPVECRRKGYATALTAALSQHILDGGKEFVTLFTNLANPISNSIYMKIGYKAVCDFDRYHFGGE